MNITLGNDVVAEIRETGFFDAEHDHDGPFRWTNGKGKLVIPLERNKPPEALRVELKVYRPVSGHVAVQVIANGQALWDTPISTRDWEHTFELKTLDLGDELHLEILSDTFQPKGAMERGTNDDPRTLGVQVRSIRLIRKSEQTLVAPELDGIPYLNRRAQALYR